MASIRWPKEVNGIPLSERSRWLLYAPHWMLLAPWQVHEVTDFKLQPIPGIAPVIRTPWLKKITPVEPEPIQMDII
jgi:hypothetical protein